MDLGRTPPLPSELRLARRPRECACRPAAAVPFIATRCPRSLTPRFPGPSEYRRARSVPATLDGLTHRPPSPRKAHEDSFLLPGSSPEEPLVPSKSCT